MVLSELTNKELKGILRENDVRNYSKLNKKGLLKKVNQLIKEQNGGKNGKGKNGKKKKYTLKDFIGGAHPVDPATPADPADPAAPAAPAALEKPGALAAPAPAALEKPGAPDAEGSLTVKINKTNPPPIYNGRYTGPSIINTRINTTSASAPPHEDIGISDATAPESKTKSSSINSALYVYGTKNNGKRNSNGAPRLPYLSQNNAPAEVSLSELNNSNKNKKNDDCGACNIL
jgi:hypothetical protein